MDKYTCLSVKQPYADFLVVPTYEDEEGFLQADKTIEVRSRNTKYRGDILICASAKPEIYGKMSGCTIGLVELYDVKPVEEFTEHDWIETCIPFNERPKKGYGWLVRNPRRVVEVPVKGQLGFFTREFPEGEITEYPVALKIDNKSMEMIKKRLK